MAMHRFSRGDLPAMPWKNGGGTTQEIVCWPPGAGLDDFAWRASIATVAAAGPFSVFPGVDRSILLLEGQGLRLQSRAFDHRLDEPHRPFDFDGAAAVDCSLLGGATADFNLMVRRALGTARMRVLIDATQTGAVAHGLLMALSGSWQVGDMPLAAGDGLYWTDEPNGWDCRPTGPAASLLAVEWRSGAQGNPAR